MRLVHPLWRISIAASIAAICGLNGAVIAQESSQRRDPLDLLSYITWWSHDDAGYHPAITFKYENASGENLSGIEIRFQARFTDLRNNYLSVKRDDVKAPSFADKEQRIEILTCRDPYELPISVDSWPQIECKVLYKMADEQEPHQLMIALVDKITMTNEEAVDKMLRMPPIAKSTGRRRKRIEAAPEQPMSATALPLVDKHDGKPKVVEKGGNAGTSSRPSAGLGDDFFDFEQSFGRPQTFDASSGKYTWAKYSRDIDYEVYVGARQPSSKADIVIAVIKSAKPLAEPSLIQMGKEFAGKLKSQPLNVPSRTVKYLPSGRVQISAMSASAYHFSIYCTTDGSDVNHYYLILSRLPGNFESSLVEQGRRSKLVHFLTSLFGDSE